MAFESAVVLPLAINTSGSGLFKKGSLELPKPSITPKSTDIWIFVYGGSTSNGSTALQLAKAAGVNVLAVAGMKNHDLCRQLGATDVVDYKDPKWIYETTDRLLGKHVVGAYDSVGTDATTKAIDEVLKAANFDVSIISTGFIPADIKGLLAFGTDATKDPELAKALREDFLQNALANGSFVPKPDFEVVGHGLEDIQQAMDMQKKSVSAKRLVVKMT